MSEKGNLWGPHDDHMIVKKKGIIDLQQLYADIRKWYVSHNYEFWERDHKVKTPTPIGTEEEIRLEGYRDEDDYVRWWIRIKLYIWDSTPVIVMKDGQKTRMFKCRVKVLIDAEMELDYQNEFEKSRFLKGLRRWYFDNVIQWKMKVEGDKFEYEVHNIQDMIKRRLGIEASGNQFDYFWK